MNILETSNMEFYEIAVQKNLREDRCINRIQFQVIFVSWNMNKHVFLYISR